MDLYTKIEYLLQEFADENKFGVDIELNPRNEWTYDHTTNIVTGTLSPDATDNLYRKVCIELGLEWNCPTMIIDLLHEVGHAMTLEDLIPIEYNLPAFWVYLKSIMEEDITDRDYEIYFLCKRERIATEWAIGFANVYAKEIKELWSKIIEVIEESRYDS